MDYNDVIRNQLKKDMYEMLLTAGETPSIIDKEHSIFSGGLKFTKIKNNSKYSYEVEETTRDDNYTIIDNLLILTLIKEYIIKVCENIKNIKTKENQLISLLTFNNVIKEIEKYNENKNR